MDRVAAACALLADAGIVVSCVEKGGAVCVHVNSPRPPSGQVDVLVEVRALASILAVVPGPVRWVP